MALFVLNKKFLKSILVPLIFTLLYQQTAWAGLHKSRSLRAKAFKESGRNLTQSSGKHALWPDPLDPRKRATATIKASDKIDREAVHSVLYSAAGNQDSQTVRELFEIFPKVEKLIFVDPAYKGLASISPLLVLRIIEVATSRYIRKWTHEGELGNGGRLIVHIANQSGGDIEVSFYAEDYYTFTPPEAQKGVDVNIVKYPGSGGEMSYDDRFYNKVVQDTAGGRYIFVKHAKLPSRTVARGLALLEKTEEKYAGGHGMYVSFSDWAVYRKKPKRILAPALAASQAALRLEKAAEVAKSTHPVDARAQRRMLMKIKNELAMLRRKLERNMEIQKVFNIAFLDLQITATRLTIEILRGEMSDLDLTLIIQDILGMTAENADKAVSYAKGRLENFQRKEPQAAMMIMQATGPYAAYQRELLAQSARRLATSAI